jgi:diguanylate cyclase (GGDEF)-like protein/PAS domain S-box-containing protein
VIRYCGAALCSLTGRNAGELVGRRVDVLLPWGTEAVLDACRGMHEGLGLSCADGRTIPVEAAATMFPDEWGAFCVLEIRPCDRRHVGQTELQRLAWSVEQSSDAVIIADADGVIEYVNPAFEAMTGFARSEAIGRKPAIMKSGHHGPEFYRDLWGALRAGVEFRDVFINRKKGGELFHADQVIRPFFGSGGRITHFVSIVRDVSDRIREIESLTHAATHDSLTNLPNRQLFFDRLGQAVRQVARRGGGLAVAVVDVDRFKAINDVYGHLAGDAVLQRVASYLQRCVRNEDTVGRLGGDEFGLILLDVSDPAAVAGLLEKILRAFASPIQVDHHAIPTSVSIGACLYPASGGDERELVQFADQAMYRAKQVGGNCCRFASMRQASGQQQGEPHAQRDQ